MTVLVCFALLQDRFPAISAVGEGDLRLDSSFSTNSLSGGRLEIFLEGEWGTVCDNGFGLIEGDVACRQLGFFSANRTGNVTNLG